MSEETGYSWFPGHMRRAMRRLEKDLDLADAVLFVVEARLPESSRNPELEEMLYKRGREIFYVMTKADLADPAATDAWLAWFREQGHQAMAINAVKGSGAGALTPALEKLGERISEGRARRGLNARDPRLVVVGLPNVGKSALLNRLVGRKQAITGDRPGVTRGKQWVVAAGKWQVMDTPGILYPRIEGIDRLACLAATGCVREEVIPAEEAAAHLLKRLVALGKAEALVTGEELPENPYELLEEAGRRKGFLMKGARVDMERTTRWVLQAFREGRVGRVTLELPPNE